MSAFELDEQGQSEVEEWARAHQFDETKHDAPGFLDGALDSIGAGIMRGGAKAADFLMTFGKQPAMSEQQERTNELADQLQDEQVKSAVDYWTPNANEVGKAGQVLGGFSEMVLPLMAAAGDPLVLIGSNTLAAGKEQIDAGVDAGTAGVNAAITGASTYAGFKMPFLGNTLATKMASGAIGNTAVNAATTAAQREILKAGGYDDLAAQYDPLDVEARTIDLLTGIAFGAVDHVAGRSLLPSEVGAIAAASNAKHFQFDTAPGRPENVRDSVAHQDAMEASTEQLIRGEPVAVPPEVTRAEFVPRAETAPVAIPEELVALDEARAADLVKSEPQPEGDGYDVAEGVLTDEQLAQFQGLRSDVQADEVVRGSGEGKPADEGAGDAGVTRGEPLRVYRGAARELGPEDFRTEALGHATGHPSSGLGVFFTNAAGDAARYGPVSEHFLDIRNPKVVAVEDLPGFDTLADADAYRKAIEAEGHDGMVIDASHLGGPVNYIAFTHDQVQREWKKRGPSNNTGKKPSAATPESKPSNEGAEPAAAREVTPDVMAAEQHLALADLQVPTGERDADGNVVTRSARELMREAEAEVAQAEADGVGYEAAISCFLTRGADAT